ncbi:MAG: MarR family EPS-associated transcriptional regulator [Deltaproteobacteria bacterium]|nr:MarR family EPS-associated transcriptional regulator [Deltaproteobacteria bacterium]
MPNHYKIDLETEEALSVLREIDAYPEMTQRTLSLRLGLSLGKINFLIQALIEKGLIKAENFKNSKNKSAYLYSLTPHGLEEKTKATYRFLKRKIEEYEKLEAQIRQLKKEAGVVDIPDDIKNNIRS